jgi:hypothetical protein
VTRATTEDHQKLERALGYLKWTTDYMLQLKPCGILKLEIYMDAAFASHVDSVSLWNTTDLEKYSGPSSQI